MKVDVGRLITLDNLMGKIREFLAESGLHPSQAVLTVEYPPMWEVEGPDIVLKDMVNNGHINDGSGKPTTDSV